MWLGLEKAITLCILDFYYNLSLLYTPSHLSFKFKTILTENGRVI